MISKSGGYHGMQFLFYLMPIFMTTDSVVCVWWPVRLKLSSRKESGKLGCSLYLAKISECDLYLICR